MGTLRDIDREAGWDTASVRRYWHKHTALVLPRRQELQKLRREHALLKMLVHSLEQCTRIPIRPETIDAFHRVVKLPLALLVLLFAGVAARADVATNATNFLAYYEVNFNPTNSNVLSFTSLSTNRFTNTLSILRILSIDTPCTECGQSNHHERRVEQVDTFEVISLTTVMGGQTNRSAIFQGPHSLQIVTNTYLRSPPAIWPHSNVVLTNSFIPTITPR